MKIVRVTISGELTPGDVIMLHNVSPRGGCTSAGTEVEKPRAVLDGEGNPVKETDSAEKIIERLRLSAVKHYLQDSYRFEVKGGALRIECQDEVDKNTFSAEIRGAGTETVDIVEF